MEVNVISASVKEREITLADYIAPTAGNVEHDALAITLDGEWGGLEKRVTFYRGEMEYTLPWDGESAITVPWEVLSEPGSFAFTVVGSENGVDRLVTSFMPKHRRVKVSVNGKDEGIQPGEPTMDVISRIDAVAADLEQKRDSGYFKGDTGDPGSLISTSSEEPGEPVQLWVDATESVEIPTMDDIPSVPEWAMGETKPTYTAAEIGLTDSAILGKVVNATKLATNSVPGNAGTQGSWSYVKFEDGLAVMWTRGSTVMTNGVTRPWITGSSIYYGTNSETFGNIQYPFTFTYVPACFASIDNLSMMPIGYNQGTTTKCPKYYIASPSKMTDTPTAYWNLFVIGRWK